MKMKYQPALRGVLVPALFLIVAQGCDKKMELPPPEVYVQAATTRDVSVTSELVGQTAGSMDVEIRARGEGFLEGVHYREGQPVKKGDLLFTLEAKTFQAVVSQRRADVASAEALVHQANLEVNRLKPLAEQQAVSRRDFDNALSTQKTAQASLDSARAALDKALLDLSYTRISAPVSGLADFAKVKAGNLVGRGDSTLLTTISNVDPIHVVVGVKEADYLRLLERAKEGGLFASSAQHANVELILSDGSLYSHRGYFDAAERAVDSRTGTLALRVVFPNPEHQVRPGQFAKLRFISETLKQAVVVPQRAVQEVQGVQQVVVVESGKTIIRNVKVGPKDRSDWVILEGLKAGESVVVEGLQKVKPGAPVVVKPFTGSTTPVAVPDVRS